MEKFKEITANEESIKWEHFSKPGTPLNQGKCSGLILAKLNINITIEEGDDPQNCKYELDLRELKEKETFKNDPKTRDFKMNSAYYSIVKREVIDITGVRKTKPGVERHKKRSH